MLLAARITMRFQPVCTFHPHGASLAVLSRQRFSLYAACDPPAQSEMMTFSYRWMVPESPTKKGITRSGMEGLQ